MTIDTSQRSEAIALFRFSLIADLLHLPHGSKEMGPLLRKKATQTYACPYGTNRTKFAVETFRHWLKLYRRLGLDGLKPTLRNDRGVSRALPKSLTDYLCDLKEEKPRAAIPFLIEQARCNDKIPEGLLVCESTVHRLLSRAGLMVINKADPVDRRRFCFEFAGDLFMSDVMHGPLVFTADGRTKRKSYLIAFIDDATRIIPYAQFSHSENAASFLPCLLEAVLRRGIPKRLYVDNGSAFRSQHLQMVCAKLGITLIHARPYTPQGKGKMERWFRTVRQQFIPLLQAEHLKSLDAINARLWAWVEGEYHRSPHGGLNQLTPMDAWANKSANIQPVGNRTDIPDMFLFEEKRKVSADRVVSLNGTAYEVDAILVGTTVVLRYKPGPIKPRRLQVIDAFGVRHNDATAVDYIANTQTKRNSPKLADSLNLRKLAEQNEGAPY